MIIACVLKTGGRYNESWVEKLQRSIQTSIPYDFVCLSDQKLSCCETILLEKNWPKWWSKLELFNVFKTERVFYMDLDDVIVGSLDPIMSLDRPFVVAHDWTHPKKRIVNSTAMLWKGDFSGLTQRFASDIDKTVHYYDVVLPKATERDGRRMVADQAYIEHEKKDLEFFNELLGSDTIISSYKLNRCDIEIPADAAIVSFHGRNKPDTAQAAWIKDFWK